MGLFDAFKKKDCEICGKEVGLLGYKKLEDGEICKDCVKLLSPFFSERRHSTVEDIKRQLAYREENKRQLSNFHPNITFGHNGRKVYVDEAQRKFIVTRSSSWMNENPDIIEFSQVTSCTTDIQEHRKEIYYRDKEGNNRSYVPPRYEFTYEFEAVINVNSPWFDSITVELSEGNRPDSTYSPAYRDLEQQLYNMASILMGKGAVYGGMGMNGMGMNGMGMNGMGMNNGAMGTVGNNMTQIGVVQGQPQQPYGQPQQGYGQQPYGQPQQGGAWVCNTCGSTNTGKFCQNCGATQRMPQSIECSECSWTPEPGAASVPAFCPNCGKRFNEDDIR